MSGKKFPQRRPGLINDLIKTCLDLDIYVVLVYVDGLMLFKSL